MIEATSIALGTVIDRCTAVHSSVSSSVGDEPRPKSEWKRVEVPEWRIVSEDLWTAAHNRIKVVSKQLGASRWRPDCALGSHESTFSAGFFDVEIAAPA
jgi:hypothetical protein